MSDFADQADRRTGGTVVNADDHGRPYADTEPFAGADGRAVDAILEGGPVSLPAELRVRQVSGDAETIKVRHYGGYEHFDRDCAAAASPAVFRWTGRTAIAE